MELPADFLSLGRGSVSRSINQEYQSTNQECRYQEYRSTNHECRSTNQEYRSTNQDRSVVALNRTGVLCY